MTTANKKRLFYFKSYGKFQHFVIDRGTKVAQYFKKWPWQNSVAGDKRKGRRLTQKRQKLFFLMNSCFTEHILTEKSNLQTIFGSQTKCFAF